MRASEIRNKFANFFEEKNHLKVSSSSLIPQNDKTLLFANAGMNQFKDYFTGKAVAKNKRAVTIQKCVRAGGKHNDLENVGLTARHHTFFEMLGNFSFGDYFKEDAIAFAWEFLTKELKIPAEKLHITVHYTDDEALKIWNEKIGIPLEKISKKGDKDNFWEMGEFGPCGPCSEIFYDHGPEHETPNYKPGEDQNYLDDEMRYVEIWNLVFMQYEKTPEGRLNLPKPSIDTGAGLERIAAALQGKYWNYDTDLFMPIINKIESLTGKKYSDDKNKSSMRIVADHIRSTTMLITDGVIPSNEGRGYVLRRIIRRAVRHLKELEAKPGSLHQLVPTVFEILGVEYQQNKNNSELAIKFLEMEERKFLETLDHGLKYLKEAISKDVKNNVLDGESAFKLYDTYGFPLDLTEVILGEQGIKVDIDGFEKTMNRRKEESKKTWKGGVNVDDKIFHQIKEENGTTKFLGYTQTKCEANLVKKIELGELTALIFNQTPFYGESGGQLGDTGVIKEGDSVMCHITDTQKPVDGLFVHYSNDADMLEEGKQYILQIDNNKRELTKRNHSATHLLQSALIEVLGDHVKQAGSSVGPERLRFDFTHLQAMTKDEIKNVEKLVNEKVREHLDVQANEMSMDSAIEKGALALFGEKYGDQVRVLTMGKFSTELCGGTHVSNTGEIELFSILSESSLSAGVRRIEATTSSNAIERLMRRSEILSSIESMTQGKNEDVLNKIEAYQNDIKSKSKEINQLKEKVQNSQSKDLFKDIQKIGENDYIFANAPEGSDLRKLSDNFISKNSNAILVMIGQRGGKTSVLIRTNKNNKEFKCDELLKLSLDKLEGKGGGKSDMAQGSCDITDYKLIFETIKTTIEEKL